MYFKVIKGGTNRKLVYDFLSVVCSNFCRITHCFWEIWCETEQWPWNMPKVIDSCITWKQWWANLKSQSHSKISNLWNSNSKSHDQNLNPNPESKQWIPISKLKIPIKSQSQISAVSTVSPLSQYLFSHNNFDFEKSTNTNISIVMVLESVTVSLPLLLPSIVTAFRAAAAETPDVYLLVTVWLAMY